MGKDIKEFYKEKAEEYFGENGRKIYKMVDTIVLKKHGSVNDRDMQEYYSIANDVFWDIALNDRYRENQGDFNGYLYKALSLAYIDEYKYKTRDKRSAKIDIEEKNDKGETVHRKIPIKDIYMDAPLDEDGNITIRDTISSDFDIEKVVLEKLRDNYSDEARKYIDSLTNRQRKIVRMVIDGYKPKEIKNFLKLTDKQYKDDWNVLSSYEKTRYLYEIKESADMDSRVITSEDTHEKFKNTSYSIKSISRKLHGMQIKDNHILQRHSGQWKSEAKSKLVGDILKGKSLTQIIIDEERVGNIRMMWLIDGKQRCTTLDEYYHNGFSISSKLKDPVVSYYVPKLDEEGKEVLNEEGFPLYDVETFDLRGKKFKDLPEQLQYIFEDRQIPILYNIDCSKAQIVDDIIRFNMSRPLNVAQFGWLGLDEELADLGEKIAQMPFFQTDFKGSKYTSNNQKSGAIRRLVVESVFVSDFLDNYEKDFKKKCEFLSTEADSTNFTDFYFRVERLSNVCDEDVADMFDVKNSFLYFGLFARFDKYGADDQYFVDFLKAFKSTLHSKQINGVAYDDIDGNSTKDKNVVVKKIKHLEALLKEYLKEQNIVINECEDNECEVTAEDLIHEYIKSDASEEDIKDYEEDLETLTVEVDNNSRLLDKRNKPSLMAIVAYGYVLEETIDKWFIGYFKTHQNYIKDQRRNLESMMDDYEKFKQAA